MNDPTSKGVNPSPEKRDKCAMRNGNSASLEHAISIPIVLRDLCTYGMIEFPDGSRTVNWAMIGGVKGTRER